MTEKRTVWGPPGGTAGTCMTCGGPARSHKAFYCEEHRTDRSGASPAKPPSEVTVEGSSSEGAGGIYDDVSRETSERRPTEPKASKPSFLERLKKSRSGAEQKVESTGERRPGLPAKRRVSTTAFWGDCVEGGASLIARGAPAYVPMARSMVWSSPVAGEIIEDATKGTPVDRLVQPVVRNAEKWQDLFDLLGFWAAIGVASNNPLQAPAAMGFARKRLVNLLPRIAANIRKQRAKEKEAVEALTELMPDLGELFPGAIEDGADPVDLLLQSLFADAPQPMAEPEPANAA